LLFPPEPVQRLPDGLPLFFAWRKLRHRVVTADGPERILGEWWISDKEIGSQCDYYRVEDESDPAIVGLNKSEFAGMIDRAIVPIAARYVRMMVVMRSSSLRQYPRTRA
jgi:hypothetical protein